MRARTSGPIATALMFLPILAIPLLAVFGIPQFVPVVASTSDDDGPGPTGPPPHLSERVGESASYPPPGRYNADDLFAPLDAPSQHGPFGQNDRTARAEEAQTRKAYEEPQASRRGAWVDPFRDGNGEPGAGQASRTQAHTVPSAASREMQSHVHQASMEIPPGASRRWHELAIHEPPAQEPRRPSMQANAGSTPVIGTRQTGEHSSGDRAAGPRPAARGTSDESPRRFVPRASRPRNPTVQPQPQPSLTWTEAVARLRGLGVRQYLLQPGEREDSFHFSCFFTPADNPRIRHRFEAEADDPLRAVANVLAQIDDWKQGRSRD